MSSMPRLGVEAGNLPATFPVLRFEPLNAKRGRRMTRAKGEGRGKDVPPTPAGWRSASQLCREYIGGCAQIKQRMEEVRRNLIAVTCERGVSEEDAVAHVEQKFIGWRRPWRGAASWTASPEAVLMLGLIPREQAAAPRPAGWRSVTQLRLEYVGDFYTLRRRMEQLREQLVEERRAAGLSLEEAERVIEQDWIGRRKPAGGSEAIAFSPEAVRAAEEAGILVRKIERVG